MSSAALVLHLVESQCRQQVQMCQEHTAQECLGLRTASTQIVQVHVYNAMQHLAYIPEVAVDSSCKRLASSALLADDSLVCLLMLSIRRTRSDRMTPSQYLARVSCSCNRHSEPIWHRNVSICTATLWAPLSCAVSSLYTTGSADTFTGKQHCH